MSIVVVACCAVLWQEKLCSRGVPVTTAAAHFHQNQETIGEKWYLYVFLDSFSSHFSLRLSFAPFYGVKRLGEIASVFLLANERARARLYLIKSTSHCIDEGNVIASEKNILPHIKNITFGKYNFILNRMKKYHVICNSFENKGEYAQAHTQTHSSIEQWQRLGRKRNKFYI